MTLTILGAHGADVWVDHEGDLFPLCANELATMRNEVRWFGTTTRAGTKFDEADVTELIQALDGPHLDDCRWCSGPGLVTVEGHAVCPGCVRAYGAAEETSA